jgi:hypothetical protein
MIGYLLVAFVRFAKLCCMHVFRKLMHLVQDVNAQPENYAQAESNM